MTLPDYYQILEVSSSATLDEIKKAYRRMALENHPDLGGSHERMLAINEAFYVLSDPNHRTAYDQYRSGKASEENRKRAEQNSAKAASAAGDYPQAFKEFNRWMDGMLQDLANARYGTGSEGPYKYPTIENSYSGIVFIVLGGMLGALVTWKLLESGYVKGTGSLLPILAGMWAGQILHGCVKATLVGNSASINTRAAGTDRTDSETFVICPKCGQKLRATLSSAGGKIRCPKCRPEFKME